jgi:hypothetical protein
MSRWRSTVPTTKVDVVHVGRVAQAKERDDDPQPHRRFRGRQRHDEEDVDLPFRLVELS